MASSFVMGEVVSNLNIAWLVYHNYDRRVELRFVLEIVPSLQSEIIFFTAIFGIRVPSQALEQNGQVLFLPNHLSTAERSNVCPQRVITGSRITENDRKVLCEILVVADQAGGLQPSAVIEQ